MVQHNGKFLCSVCLDFVHHRNSQKECKRISSFGNTYYNHNYQQYFSPFSINTSITYFTLSFLPFFVHTYTFLKPFFLIYLFLFIFSHSSSYSSSHSSHVHTCGLLSLSPPTPDGVWRRSTRTRGMHTSSLCLCSLCLCSLCLCSLCLCSLCAHLHPHLHTYQCQYLYS